MATNPVETNAPPTLTGSDGERINHLKPAVDPSSITWRDLRRDAFWHRIPAWADVDEATFLDHRWQDKNAITSPKKLVDTVRDLASPDFIQDVEAGFAAAPMRCASRPTCSLSSIGRRPMPTA
jgi:lysine 2,3-aminomutase